MKQITLEDISNIENLYWAWEKVRNFFKPGEIWFDEFEVAEFELNLHENLTRISEDIKSGAFQLSKIKPIAFPKGPDENNNKPRVRQYFWIQIKDQVAWMAIVNLIGPILDYKMPYWSYGNRLHLPVWYEEEEGEKQIKFGWYRNTSSNTYRKWNQSWPMYRRHISITIKHMSKTKVWEEKEREAIELNEKIPKYLKVKYLEEDFWSNNKRRKDVYWASIDLKKFYPSISNQIISQNIKQYVSINNSVLDLIHDMLVFRIDTAEWTNTDFEDENIFHIDDTTNYRALPTGLFVAGFLSNVSLLKIDRSLSSKIDQLRNIAHFRFVDDHVFVANDFDHLLDWIRNYIILIEKSKLGITLNKNKIEPTKLAKLISSDEKVPQSSKDIKKENPGEYKEAKKESIIDPVFQSPLMTATLKKISNIAQTDFHIMSDDEFSILLSDVEHLLLSDFADHEVKKDTRLSFAARMLSLLAPLNKIDQKELIKSQRKKVLITSQIEKLNKEKKKYKVSSREYKSIKKQLDEFSTEREEVLTLLKDLANKQSQHLNNYLKHNSRVFQKIIKESPDKIKLWLRFIEYCQKIGDDNFIVVFEWLDEVGDCHDYSRIYLRAVLLQILSRQLIKSYRVLSNTYCTEEQKTVSVTFINSIYKFTTIKRALKNNHGKKYYLTSSELYFKTILSSVYYLLIYNQEQPYLKHFSLDNYQKLVDRFDLPNWHSECRSYFKNFPYSIPSGVWLLSKTFPHKEITMPNMMWKFWIKSADLNCSMSWKLISLYPKYIPKRILKEIKSFNGGKALLDNQGWLIELKENENYKVLDLSQKVRHKKNEYIDLLEWADLTNRELQDKPDIYRYDPRYSEWTSLEIIKQIARLLKDKVEIIKLIDRNNEEELFSNNYSPYYSVHPGNYLIIESSLKKSWDYNNITPTWEGWKNFTENGKSFVKLCSERNIISDNRYTPTFFDVTGELHRHRSLLYGLGILLVGLLSRNFSFHPRFNLPGIHNQKTNFVLSKLRDIPISTLTINILRGVFSRRHWEEPFIKVNQNDLKGLVSDKNFDPPIINNLDSLISKIDIAQQILESYQLSVQNHKPRHLIPVDLFQLTKNNNPYKGFYE